MTSESTGSMFDFLLKKSFLGSTVLLVAFGVFLYFIDIVAEQAVSYFIGTRFYYVELPFLKLIYVLLLVVTLGVFSGVHRKEDISDTQKQTITSRYLLTILIATLIGFSMHLYFVIQEMNLSGSLLELEQDLFRYFITDFFLVLGFLFAGLKIRTHLH